MKNIYKSSSFFILLGNLPVLFFLINSFYTAPPVANESTIENVGLRFDGSDDHIITNSPVIGNADFTVEFWFQSQISGSGNGQSFISWVDANSQNGFQDGLFITDVSNNIQILDGNFNNANAYVNPFPNTNVRDGAWHHFAFAKSGNNVTVFLDNASYTYVTNITCLLYTSPSPRD